MARWRKSVSHLPLVKRQNARRLIKNAAYLALRHASVVHYTQGPRRWDGIRLNLKAYRGQYPHYADCSAFATWCIWNGLDHYHKGDTVNGQHWQAGYTGTMLEHGRRVLGRWKVGDCVIYGNGFPGEHTAVVVNPRRKLVISHGSEAGPFLLNAYYRGDVMQVRRYV